MNSIVFALYGDLISDMAAFHSERVQQRQQALATLIPAIGYASAQAKERNRLESCDLNVFRFFSPGETTHSRLLAYFLDPEESHGQGHLFLIEFLRLLGISESDSVSGHPWIVTAEVGRVDVLIKRAHPHTVVIIENKSNFAADQPNQLYRYWHQEIYQKQRANLCSAIDVENPPASHYRLVYLSPASWKQADAQSSRRPATWDTSLPEVVPMKTDHHLFGEFVVQWLSNSIALLPPSNHRLLEFTKQYIQFWQFN
jgi:hypothetical protein